MATARRIVAVLASFLTIAGSSGEDKGEFLDVAEPFPVPVVNVQERWVPGSVPSADAWRPAVQGDLAAALADAPKLSFETIADPPRRIGYGPFPFLCPNPDGKTWDIVSPYRKKYGSHGQVYVHDLGTGEHRVFAYGMREEDLDPGEKLLSPELSDFHMKASYYVDRKMLFILPAGPGGRNGSMFAVYDPAVNDFVSCTLPFERNSMDFGSVLGEDGRIYGCRLSGKRDSFYYYVYDPQTYETKVLPAVGDGQKSPFPHYRGFAKFGDWAYAKFGHEPWHLTAYNFRTGEFRYLARTRKVKGDHKTIRIQVVEGEGLVGHIRHGEFVDGFKDFDHDEFRFYLHEGRVHAMDGGLPPWSGKPLAEVKKRVPKWSRRCREFQRWPKGFWDSVSEPPEVREWSTRVDGNGVARLQYRFPDTRKSKEWSTIQYRVRLYSGIVRRLIEVNESTLFAVDEGYGQNVVYDVANRRAMRYFAPMSPYGMAVHGGSVYVTGYPHFLTSRYRITSLAENPPEVLGNLGKENDTHTPLAGVVSGIDGCVYIAGTTVGRRRDGGGVVSYDPKSGKTSMVPAIDNQRVFWMTAASGGRYILLSTKSEEPTNILCWDVLKKQFIYRTESPTSEHAGPLVEALPGLVIGFASGGSEGAEGTLYGFEAATGTPLWVKPVPVAPITAFSQVRRHAYTFRRGPDGFVWATFGGTLVRIDPRNAEVIPVGKMEPAQIAFAQNGVFVAGGDLRKAKGLEVRSVPPVE